jgi:hypothetical protein
MKRTRIAGLVAVACVAAAAIAHAAGIFPGFPIAGSSSYPTTTGNELVPADTGNVAGINPATVLLPSSVLAGSTYQTPRNFLGNGALNVTNTNGTSTVTCAANAAMAVASLSADRWGCQSNVGSSTGRSQIITASPAPPTGFINSMKVWRNTVNSVVQPICVWQAVPLAQSTQLAGQTVTFSAQVAGLGVPATPTGIFQDNGGVANLVIIAGSGSDQGLNQAPTASPSILIGWTNATQVVNTPIQLTAAFQRFQTTAIIPATVGSAAAVTEVGVAICFTPVATSGVTAAVDGFAFTGAQLEKAPSASLFETRSAAVETIEAMQFYYKVAEGAAWTFRGWCNDTTANTALQCAFQFPVPMYKIPTVAFTAGFAVPTTTAQTALTACTALAADATLGTQLVSISSVVGQCTSAGTTVAVGLVLPIVDNGGAGLMTAWTGL